MMQTLPASSPAVSFPFQLTEQQRKALDAIRKFLEPTDPNSIFLLAGYAGTGKAQPIDTPVLTPTGWKLIGKLQQGDSIIAGDGSRTKVILVAKYCLI